MERVLSLHTLRIVLVMAILLIASYKDIRERRIPDWCVIALGLLAILRLLEGTAVGALLSGSIPVAAIYALILIAEGVKGVKLIGRGDIKLLFVLGLHYEIVEMLYIILISCIIALGYFMIISRDKKRGIALCPMISIGVFIITMVR